MIAPADIRDVLDQRADVDTYDRLHRAITGQPMRDERAAARIRDLMLETARVATRKPVEV